MPHKDPETNRAYKAKWARDNLKKNPDRWAANKSRHRATAHGQEAARTYSRKGDDPDLLMRAVAYLADSKTREAVCGNG